jgi:hypothetical protein
MMRRISFALASLTLFLAAGCGASEPPRPVTAAPASPEVTREAAIRTAQIDAMTHFRGLSILDVTAHRYGAFWLVEIRAPGAGFRYAISRADGSIRQRNMTQ